MVSICAPCTTVEKLLATDQFTLGTSTGLRLRCPGGTVVQDPLTAVNIHRTSLRYFCK